VKKTRILGAANPAWLRFYLLGLADDKIVNHGWVVILT